MHSVLQTLLFIPSCFISQVGTVRNRFRVYLRPDLLRLGSRVFPFESFEQTYSARDTPNRLPSSTAGARRWQHSEEPSATFLQLAVCNKPGFVVFANHLCGGYDVFNNFDGHRRLLLIAAPFPCTRIRLYCANTSWFRHGLSCWILDCNDIAFLRQYVPGFWHKMQYFHQEYAMPWQTWCPVGRRTFSS